MLLRLNENNFELNVLPKVTKLVSKEAGFEPPTVLNLLNHSQTVDANQFAMSFNLVLSLLSSKKSFPAASETTKLKQL